MPKHVAHLVLAEEVAGANVDAHVSIERELGIHDRAVDHLQVAGGDHALAVRRDLVLADTNLDVPVLGEIEVVVEDDVVLAERVDLELVLVVLAKACPWKTKRARRIRKVVLDLARLVGVRRPHLTAEYGPKKLHADTDSQLKVIVRAVDLDALAGPEFDVPTIDDVIPHHFVLALGMELIARSVTSNPFLGFCLLVGLFGRVVLPRLCLGRRHHDDGRPFRCFRLLDRLFERHSCCSWGRSPITSSEVGVSSVASPAGGVASASGEAAGVSGA